MAKATVSRTALGAATCRLIEQYQPKDKRLFDDPVVAALINQPIPFLLRFAWMRNYTIRVTDSFTPGIFGAQICRSRYIDDTVEAALAQGIRQLVILGAGLDTRPYRLAGMEAVQAFEVDLPAVQQNKKKKIQKYFGRLPEKVSFVPIDFDQQTLANAFTGTAFDPSIPAAFIWEGVTQYITEAAVRQTLEFVGQIAPGSSLVFTYVLKSIIERRSDIPGANQLMDTVSRDSPWLFGLEPGEVGAFLQPYHLALIAEVGNADYQQRYLRPCGRRLVVSEGERIAQARVV